METLHVVTVTDMVGRSWETWPIAVFSSVGKAEDWLYDNGCVEATNPGGKIFFHDGLRTYDIVVCGELDQPEKFRFAHAAGV